MGKSAESMNHTKAEPIPDRVDNMEEKTWVISKKGDKNSSILLLFIGSLTLIFVIYLVSGICLFEPTPLIAFIDAIYIFLLVVTYYILKVTGNWNNPKIIKLNNNELITEEKFPDGYIKRFVIPLDGIYRITIKRRKAILEYKLSDGRDFIWGLIQPGYAKEDKEKLKEVLEEILKSVDRNKVEIVGRR
jgi:hypothetical protein